MAAEAAREAEATVVEKVRAKAVAEEEREEEREEKVAKEEKGAKAEVKSMHLQGVPRTHPRVTLYVSDTTHGRYAAEMETAGSITSAASVSRRDIRCMHALAMEAPDLRLVRLRGPAFSS